MYLYHFGFCTRVRTLSHSVVPIWRLCFFSQQFWLEAVQGGAGTPAEWRQPAEDTAKWVARPFGHWAHCWMLPETPALHHCAVGWSLLCSSVRLLTERQGDDVSVLQAEARDISRHYERSCKVHRSPVMLVVSVRVCAWRLLLFEIFYLDLLVCRLWRSWQRATGYTALSWLIPCPSIHAHRKKFAGSGTSVLSCQFSAPSFIISCMYEECFYFSLKKTNLKCI